MATVKVITSFSRLRDDDLDTKAQFILDKMANNVNYPSPMPSLADITTARTEYVQALADSKQGGKEKIALKNQKRVALETLLGQLALYVQLNCQNDLAILLSSGFEARKPNRPVGILSKPENFKVEDGPNAGTIKLSVNKIDGADSYLFEYALAPINSTTQWITKAGSMRTFTIEGLVSGTQYAFRVAGVGSNPTLVYSDVVMRYAQ